MLKQVIVTDCLLGGKTMRTRGQYVNVPFLGGPMANAKAVPNWTIPDKSVACTAGIPG